MDSGDLGDENINDNRTNDNPEPLINPLKNAEKDFISINPEATREFIKNSILNEKTKEEMIKSKKKIEEIKLLVEKKIVYNPNYLTYKQILLPENSIEFAVMTINECFKKDYENDNIIYNNNGYVKEIQDYYLNNLILAGEKLNEKPQYLLKLEDKPNLKYSFDNLKNNEDLSNEFCKVINDYFRKKYNNQYTFEILSIKKGSRDLLINSNIPKKLFDEFIDFINKNAEKDIGVAKLVMEQKNIREIKFSPEMIDTLGNFDFTNHGETQIRGGLPYYQPKGWMRIGLKVKGRFGNDDWLAMDGNVNEWAVGFHGFRSVENAMLPIQGNLISLEKWAHACKGHKNLNSKTNSKYTLCGVGVYFGDKIEVCEINNYTGSCKIGNKNVKLAFQCRLNPEEIRLTNFNPSLAYIVPNQNNDDYSKIRPYGILLKIE